MVLNFSLVCFGKFKHLNKTHLFRLIGHNKNNLSRDKNENVFNYSKNNIVIELKKLVQKIDNREYKNLEKELATRISKKFYIVDVNFQYIKLYLSNYNLRESRIFYFLKNIFFFLNYNILNKNLNFLKLNQIMSNKNIKNDLKEFTKNFVLSNNKKNKNLCI